MKIKNLLFLSVFLLPLLNGSVYAQDSIPCYFDTILHQQKLADPKLERQLRANDYGVKRFKEENPNLQFYPKPQPAPPCDICMSIEPTCFKTKYVLPVLVHIIHLSSDTVGQGSNIPIEHVNKAMATLNRKFAGYNISDTMAANTGIQFYLAPLGPNSNGIFRYSSPMSNHIGHKDSAANLLNLIDSQYRYGHYINLFIVNQINNPSVSGYATMPTTGFNQLITIARQYFGDYNNCSECDIFTHSNGKTIAHEFGHYLNLYHTFHDTCSGGTPSSCDTEGDKCCDTPPVLLPNRGCSGSHPNSCSETPDDMPDQTENFMDYSGDACSYWFTQNQAERMHYALEYLRPELINIDTLISHNPDICLFSARFKTLNNVLCDTGTVTLKAIPYTTTGVKYHWTFYDSTQTVFLDTMVSDTSILTRFMNSQGFYSVRLKVIYGTDTATEFINQAIWITDCKSSIAHEAGNWFFGEYAGLVFTESGVRPSTDAWIGGSEGQTINSSEGCMSLSDSMGNLMFYGGGEFGNTGKGKLYNKNHDLLNDPFALFPLLISGTAAQNSLAFPCPFDQGKMMVVQNNAHGRGMLSYSLLVKDTTTGLFVIDTATRNTPIVLDGFGDTLVIAEYLTAAPKCNANGYWLAVVINHDNHRNTLAIISVDINGFVLADSQYLYHTYEYAPFQYAYTASQAKFSPDATKLAIYDLVFDFDRQIGKLSNELVIPDIIYGISSLSFSPNSRYFYWIDDNEDGLLKRIDLSRNNPIDNIEIFPPNDMRHCQMQIGPDGKIYIALVNSNNISVINYPNQPKEAIPNYIGFELGKVPLQIGGTGGKSQTGLPNFIDALRPELVKDTIYYTISDCNKVKFSTTACCNADYLWIYGDGDTSQQKKTEHIFSEYGEYEVKLVLDFTDTIRVTLPLNPPVVNISGWDTICYFNQSLSYFAQGVFSNEANYQWSIDSGFANSHPSDPSWAFIEVHSVPALLKVHVEDSLTGCSASDSMLLIFSYGVDSNFINNGVNFLAYNNSDSSHFSMGGSTPTGGEGGFTYQWFISYDINTAAIYSDLICIFVAWKTRKTQISGQ